MLYPQANMHRQMLDLSGIWDFRFADSDTEDLSGGFAANRPIAVPASWNEQFADERDHLGPAWYQTRFTLPWGWEQHEIHLRFNSVNYLADVWLNGEKLGQHEGGHLPFGFRIHDRVKTGENLLVVRVDGQLAFDRVPPGNIPPGRDSFSGFLRNHPAGAFDFYPYCGIQRPVIIYAKPKNGISDLTVTTTLDGAAGIVHVRTEHGLGDAVIRYSLHGHGADITQEGGSETDIHVPQAALWEPGAPNLYTLKVTLLRDGQAYDTYTLPVGIRTITVEGDRLLLNGRPVKLTGFGRHEDFPIAGRGLVPAVIVKDYELLNWIGANSFRTSHYPYSEQMMQLADQLGFLVIDEIAAVGLYFGDEGTPRRLELCQQYLRELIARDKNHPSVIMWSIANEPDSNHDEAEGFFRNLTELTRSLDATRPVTLVNRMGIKEEKAFDFVDVVCLNRYNGWYVHSGRLDDAIPLLAQEIDQYHEKYGKPIILAEFGADTIPGHHAQPPEMFSEEYQAEMLERVIAMLDERPYVVGQHVWNMCDFKTSQGVIRTNGMNYKGVFTRDRRPKMAAHKLREIWKKV